MNIWWILLIILILTIIIIGGMKKRGYFWKKRDGTKLSLKEFFKEWGKGVEDVTPLQQTRIVLWSFPALLGGVCWGIVMTLLAGTYWMALILIASLPITSVQILSTWQRYKRLKLTEELMKQLNGKSKK